MEDEGRLSAEDLKKALEYFKEAFPELNHKPVIHMKIDTFTGKIKSICHTSAAFDSLPEEMKGKYNLFSINDFEFMRFSDN